MESIEFVVVDMERHMIVDDVEVGRAAMVSKRWTVTAEVVCSFVVQWRSEYDTRKRTEEKGRAEDWSRGQTDRATVAEQVYAGPLRWKL